MGDLFVDAILRSGKQGLGLTVGVIASANPLTVTINGTDCDAVTLNSYTPVAFDSVAVLLDEGRVLVIGAFN